MLYLGDPAECHAQVLGVTLSLSLVVLLVLFVKYGNALLSACIWDTFGMRKGFYRDDKSVVKNVGTQLLTTNSIIVAQAQDTDCSIYPPPPHCSFGGN